MPIGIGKAILGYRRSSNKTRIETHYQWEIQPRTSYATEEVPIKQGLKHNCRYSITVNTNWLQKKFQ